ncbi:MAG: alpha/beta hydrolase [Actinomycetota bacterium]|nr:alpha/beta hydrolase [Actinomycetota bacterium]
MRTASGRTGRQLAWEEYGDPAGVPVVLLHGTPGGRLGAAPRDGLFAELGLRVLATDRAGYGGSEPSRGRTVLSHADDVLDVLDAVRVQQAFVVGGSGGGPHALAVGVAAPERVRAVGVLVGAVPLLPGEIAGQVAFNQQALAVLHDEEQLRKHVDRGRAVVLEDGIEGLLADAPAIDRAARADVADALAVAFGDALAPGAEGWVDDYFALWRDPWGFAPEDVSVPVLWAHGTLDLNVPYAAARRLADRLPHGELITWDDVGHAVTPDLLADFFRRLIGTR